MGTNAMIPAIALSVGGRVGGKAASGGEGQGQLLGWLQVCRKL
jgi:hypothetical protein